MPRYRIFKGYISFLLYVLWCSDIHLAVTGRTVQLWSSLLFPHSITAPSGPGPPHYRGFTITLRHTTLGRKPLDEWSAPCRDLYLTTHNTHKRQTSITPAGLETTIPANERPQTHALHRTTTGIGMTVIIPTQFSPACSMPHLQLSS
jgi:hypothetical protein